MDSVSLWEAWGQWAAGDPTLKDAYLWGLKVLWWARIGKFMAFASGLILVIDIIGPQRILAYIEKLVGDGYFDRRKVDQRALKRSLTIFGGAAGLFVLVFVVVVASGTDMTGSANPVLAAAGVLLVCSVPVLVTINHLLPRILRWLFQHDRVLKALRVASLAAFAIGFHFDMLGS